MTRDHKIGLALGILLVGAVAAFFYRHEDPVRAPLPELNSATELDEEISRQKHAPYLEAPARQSSPATQPLQPIAGVESGGLVPDPIALDAGPSQNSTTRLASSTSLNANGPDRSAAASSRKHIVQRGDTLSSIAAQHLGSAARFEEIFEANRDRLRDANDLRIGQELNIPGTNLGPSATSTPTITPPQQPSASEIPSSIPSGRFIPHSAIRGAGPRIAAPPPATTPSAANRRLSQIPPDDQVIRR